MITSGMSQPLIILAFFAVLASAGLLFIYLLCILRAINMALRTLRTGERRGYIPMPLIIINSCFALLNFIGAGFDVSRGNGAAAAAAICMSAFLLGMAAVLNVVRRGE
jgi:hypothetical protein